MAHSLFFLYGLLQLALGETDWPFASFQTGHWQPPHLALRKTGGTNHDPGVIFIPVRNYEKSGTAPTIFDNDGDMVWQGPQEKTMDFKMQKLFGQDVITYWRASHQTGVAGYGYGKTHILDNTYKEIYTVTLQDDFHTPSGKASDSYIDVHEHYITPDNTMLVTAVNLTQTDLSGHGGKPGMWVIDALFYEIDIPTNQILFKWDALEHIPPSKTRISISGGDKPLAPWDPYHMNSVTATKGGYLVNIRHHWSVFYINKNGSVRWQLSGRNDGSGDFTSDGQVKFAWQHDVRVHNETDESLVLSLLNNNARRSGKVEGPSTGVVIHLDLVNMKASRIYDLADPADHIVTGTQGSFQFLRYPETGHMLLGYGFIPKLKEFDGDGNVVLSGQFGNAGNAEAYRVFKFPWHATPHWDPVLVVNHTTEYTTDIYMSWNGATDYDNWALFSVPSKNSTLDEGKRLLVHERIGFETRVPLEGIDVKYIMAVARQDDKALGKSSIEKFAS